MTEKASGKPENKKKKLFHDVQIIETPSFVLRRSEDSQCFLQEDFLQKDFAKFRHHPFLTAALLRCLLQGSFAGMHSCFGRAWWSDSSAFGEESWIGSESVQATSEIRGQVLSSHESLSSMSAS
jgi:hypothetical protein